jgi:CheY-like chemotaxis protein
VSREGGFAKIVVRDNGMGMDREFLTHAFETFSQADRTLDRRGGGLGIGLALVKGLVELHGGDVTASSEGLGHGAMFAVRLPIDQTDAAALPRREAMLREVTPARARRVLIIEDNRDAADTLQSLIEMLGHEVVCAYTGSSGLNAARTFSPEIILCDIGLPDDMDGYAVARAIRADLALASVRLVALTGYGQEEDRRRAFEAGFNEHFTKPVDPVLLGKLLGESAPAVSPVRVA